MSRDIERARAFGERAYSEGHLQDHTAATKLQWAAEDRAREVRRRRWATIASLPPIVWLVLFFAVLLAAAAVSSWITTHPILSVLLVVGVGAFVVWRRRTALPVVEAVEVAPPDVRRAVKPIDPLSTPMTIESRAVHDALDPGKGRLYLEALERGVIPPPTYYRLQGRAVVSVPLPGGRVAPDDVRLERFAQTLGVDPSRVRRGPDTPGVIVLDVLDVAPADMTVGPWPSLGSGTSWGDPCPVGVDEVGAPVTLSLSGSRVLVTGATGSGKSVAARLLAIHALTDPAVRVHVLDHKGDGSWRAVMERAVWSHMGPEVTPDVLDHLRALRDEMRARYAAVAEGRPADTAPVVLVIDECHQTFKDKAATEVLEEIARTGRQAGFSLILATQLPRKEDLPTSILAQMNVRVVMRAGVSWAGLLLLERADIDTRSLARGHAQVWTPDDGTEPRRTVLHYVSDADIREHLGVLPALPPAPAMPVIVEAHEGDVDDDEGPDEDAPDLLRDVQSAIAGRAGIGWDELADALGMTRAEVQAALRPHGITSAAFYSQETRGTVRGVRADAVEAALRA